MATCGVCRRRAALYKCPRCGVDYCASSCYASHGDCSEAFYKWQVDRELKTRRLLGEKPKHPHFHVRDLLSETKDEIDESLSRMRLIELSRGAEPTPEEEARAVAAAKRGELRVEAPWVEWWRGLDATSQAPLHKDLPPFSSLNTRAKPSPLLAYTLLDLILTYASVCRAFDGEHADLPELAAATLVEGSPSLSRDARHHDAFAALSATLETTRRATAAAPRAAGAGSGAAYYALSLLDDAAILVCARQVATYALLDAYRLLLRAKAPKKVAAKLNFVLLWTAHEANDDTFPKLSKQCAEYREELLENSGVVA